MNELKLLNHLKDAIKEKDFLLEHWTSLINKVPDKKAQKICVNLLSNIYNEIDKTRAELTQAAQDRINAGNPLFIELEKNLIY